MSGDRRADWRALSREAGLRPSGDTIEVRFADDRRQTVVIEEHQDGSIRLWSIVARPSALRELRTPQLDAWHRNRLSEFVGFSLDRRGRMIGEAWLPPGEIAADEWGFYIISLARACDRYEYLLTGRDEA
jgi:hypothetical protein